MSGLNIKEMIKNGELDLSSKGLKEIPVQQIQNNAKQITSLNLSNNKIGSIPKNFWQLTNLVRLDISKNHLKGLPDGVGQLVRLEHLNLSNNQLTALPNSLQNLRRLKYADFRNNPLAAKYSKIVVTSNGGPQQTAKNIVKGSSSTSNNAESDQKNKKKEEDGENKKKKNADKNPPNGLNQVKQKNKKKTKKSFANQIRSSTLSFLEYTLYVVLLGVLSLYALSYYNEPLFNTIKDTTLPYWNKFLGLYFSEESILQINDGAVWLWVTVKDTISVGIANVVYAARKSYTYLTTDETVQLYLSNVGSSLKNIWLSIIEGYQKLTGQTS